MTSQMATWNRYGRWLYSVGQKNTINRYITRWTRDGKSQLPQHMIIHPEVTEALSSHKPLVALETTIITHGMPYPDNIKTALSVEDVVRRNGVVPATIGIINGRIHIGLTRSELEYLADPKVSKLKVSRRDMAFCLSQGLNGGTTVSSTMICSHTAGISVFITGGIGGVHRGGHNTLDISADLTELGRTPVTVISSGIKSILDIPRTLEYLETQGVTVVTYGNSKEFPAFFSPQSGVQVEYNLETPEECAKLIDTNIKCHMESGILIGVPLIQSTDNMGSIVQEAINESLNEAELKGVYGKDVTPFVLERVNKLTHGESLRANIDLIHNNADIGSMISLELSKLQSTNNILNDNNNIRYTSENVSTNNNIIINKPVVIGAAITDFIIKVKSKTIMNEATNIGSLRTSYGGVGRNIAESLMRFGCDPLLVSMTGTDTNSDNIINHMTRLGMNTSGIYRCSDVPSSTYSAVLDGTGELYCGIGDINIEEYLDNTWINKFKDTIQSSSLVCVDGNIHINIMRHVFNMCYDAGVPIWFEPTCIQKSVKPFISNVHHMITYTSPNIYELMRMNQEMTGHEIDENISNISRDEKVELSISLSQPIIHHIPHVLVTLGRDGVLYISRDEGKGFWYPATPTELNINTVINVTGAGDSMVGGIISDLIRNKSMDHAIKTGLKAAYCSLQSPDTVSHDLSPNQFLTREWLELEPKSFKL